MAWFTQEAMDLERSRYVVISADGHAGADLRGYRPYLESSLHDDFDRWADAYVNPFVDLLRPEANRNWDSEVRNAALEADGVVGEVVYPNTVPPFFPRSGLVASVPPAEQYRLRLAGLRAHNRWLADWCAKLPGRRAGIGQVLLNDVDDAISDVEWIADHGLTGGVLLPGMPPGIAIDPLHSPRYDPVWRACEERGVVLNVHGGSGSPDPGLFPASPSMFVLEASFFAHRPLWSLVMSGVFDRFPRLKLVFAEAGSSWVPNTLRAMDNIQAKQESGNIGVMTIRDPLRLKRKPSEYLREYNLWGFMKDPHGVRLRHDIGVKALLWGSDFAHAAGDWPHSHKVIEETFVGVPENERYAMLAGNAIEFFGLKDEVPDVGEISSATVAA